MTNTLVTARCSDEVITLIDKVGKMYGISRAELMRTGAIRYCQELLTTDTLERINDIIRVYSAKVDEMSEEDKNIKYMIEKLTEEMSKVVAM